MTKPSVDLVEMLIAIRHASVEAAKGLTCIWKEFERGITKEIRIWIEVAVQKLYLAEYRRENQGLWLI